MKIVSLRLAALDDFLPGDCATCPIYNPDACKCPLDTPRNSCPMQIEFTSGNWGDDDDISD